ncbi:MAG: hypothetical protein JNL59_04345 [Chitinophagaceae bacterium]|nr:hypothetical protein [Chitinophagaceae bacterium]
MPVALQLGVLFSLSLNRVSFIRYGYGHENRLTDVYTGRDSVMLYFFPEREAHYSYYKHGPLARAELGQLRVQGMDYAYTLQGWLKAVNPAMGGTPPMVPIPPKHFLPRRMPMASACIITAAIIE